MKTLLDRSVSHNKAEWSQESQKSLDSYAVASRAQQRKMSKIMSGAPL